MAIPKIISPRRRLTAWKSSPGLWRRRPPKRNSFPQRFALHGNRYSPVESTPMRIEKDHLTAILNCDVFVRMFCDYATDVLRTCRLHPVASKPRVIEAHGAWKNDLTRV